MTPEDTLARLRELVTNCRQASFRDRRGPAREAGHVAMLIERSEDHLTDEDLGLLVEAFTFAVRHHTSPGRWQAALRRVTTQQRLRSGLPDPVTTAEAAKTLDIEMGALVLHDAASGLPDGFFEPGTASHRNARNEGSFFDIALGADCQIKVRLRYVEADEPDLMLKELGRVTSATAQGYLNCPSNQLVAKGGGSKSLEIPVTGAELLVCGFLVGFGRRQEIVCVACPSRGSRPDYQEASLDLY